MSNSNQTALLSRVPPSLRLRGEIRASFTARGERTQISQLYESGGLRLKHPNPHAGCEAVLLNTGGGFAGGDKADLRFALGDKAEVTLTTQAAEKIYRGAPAAELDVALDLGEAARLDYLPQETILFDGARLRRRLTLDMAATARALLVEITVFGRLARGETAIRGGFRDSWRIRRAGKLVFADETRLDGEIGALLDRPAIGGGARSTALVVLADEAAEDRLGELRAVLDCHAEGVEAGASAFNGLLVARCAAPSPEPLRAAIVAAIACLRGHPPPRVWV